MHGYQSELPDRIQTSLMKWMAAPNAPQPFADPSPHAVFFHRLHHIYRTRRLKPAGRGQHRRQPSLVDTQRAYDRYHFYESAAARSRSANGAKIDALRGLRTISQSICGHSARCRRNTLPGTPLNAVADHRSAQSFGNGKADSHPRLVRLSPRHAKCGEQRAGKTGAVIINRSEVGRAQDPRRPGKCFNGSSGRLFRR